MQIIQRNVGVVLLTGGLPNRRFNSPTLIPNTACALPSCYNVLIPSLLHRDSEILVRLCLPKYSQGSAGTLQKLCSFRYAPQSARAAKLYAH